MRDNTNSAVGALKKEQIPMHQMLMGGLESAHTPVTRPWAFAVFLAAIPLSAAVLACGDAVVNGPNGPKPITSVEITLAQCSFDALGQTLQLTAVARDEDNQTVANASFTWTSSDAAVVSVSGNTATAEGNGTTTITATASSQSASITCAVEQDAVQLAFGTDPVGGQAEDILATQPTVEVQDANGNVVTTDNTTVVTAAIGTNPSGGTLGGTTSATAASGVASFSNLTIDKAGEGYTLTGSADGFTSVTSADFDVAANIASITCSPTPLELHSLNEEATLSAVARSPSGAEQSGVTFDWSSSDELVVTVSNAGVVTAVDNGNATVSASAGGVSGDCDVTVEQVATELTISPHFKALAAAEVFNATITATDALGNDIAAPAINAVSRDDGVATVAAGPPVSVTGQALGVTDVVVSSNSVMDSLRAAVVSQSGFAVLFSNSSDEVWIDAAPGSTLVLSFWMLRPSGGNGDLASISGTLQWDATQLTYVSSAITEASWSWFPNETNVNSGSLGFAAFSATGTAASFELAQVTFTVSGASGGSTTLTSTLTAAGNALGTNILPSMQTVGSAVRIP